MEELYGQDCILSCNEEPTPKNLLEWIAGCDIDEAFGMEFLDAFRICLGDGRLHDAEVAAYTCSLYLSCVFAGFPTEKMHTFVHCSREIYRRLSFDCRMYEKLFAHMNRNVLILISGEKKCIEYQCNKQEIFEAFDFYTNQ